MSIVPPPSETMHSMALGCYPETGHVVECAQVAPVIMAIVHSPTALVNAELLSASIARRITAGSPASVPATDRCVQEDVLSGVCFYGTIPQTPQPDARILDGYILRNTRCRYLCHKNRWLAVREKSHV